MRFQIWLSCIIDQWKILGALDRNILPPTCIWHTWYLLASHPQMELLEMLDGPRNCRVLKVASITTLKVMGIEVINKWWNFLWYPLGLHWRILGLGHIVWERSCVYHLTIQSLTVSGRPAKLLCHFAKHRNSRMDFDCYWTSSDLKMNHLLWCLLTSVAKWLWCMQMGGNPMKGSNIGPSIQNRGET